MPRSRWFALALVLLAWPAARAGAAFVVVANTSDKVVRFTLSHPGGASRSELLGPGEARQFPVGREPELAVTLGGKSARYRLDPYSAYVFAPTRDRSGATFQGIELAAPLPKPDDVPADPPAETKPLRVAVKLLVDDADGRSRAVWEKALRQRVAAASEVFERQCGVALDVAAVGEWASDPDAADLGVLLKDFEKKVKPDPAAVAIGFTSRLTGPPKEGEGPTHPLGCLRGPLTAHVLIREGHPRTEIERVEWLVHEVAHRLGAAHTPDPWSSMRAKLGDGRARLAKFRIGLDPLNLLAVGVWVEELRGGKVKGWGDLRPASRQRLLAIYKTLALALPDDPVASDYLGVLDRGPAVAANPAGPKPGTPAETQPPKQAEKALSPRDEAVRKVVRAVAIRAAEIARLPANSPDRPKGDQLTAEYVRVAASVAITQEESFQASAFLIGIGVSLDDSTLVRDNPLTRGVCHAVETDAEFRERSAALGVPTVRHRRDLCQHFAVSAMLTELWGHTIAEAAGLAKERLDMRGTSGFSFVDLTADFSGVAFARKVHGDPRFIQQLRVEFRVDDFVPPITGLREGLSEARFKADYGSETDPRFRQALDEVRKRVAEMAAYKKP